MKNQVLKICLLSTLLSTANATTVNINIDPIDVSLVSDNMDVIINNSDSAYIECNWADWTGIEDGKTRYSKKVKLEIKMASGQIVKFKTTEGLKLKKRAAASLNDCNLRFDFKAVVKSDPNKRAEIVFFNLPLKEKVSLDSNMLQDAFDNYQLIGIDRNNSFYSSLRKR